MNTAISSRDERAFSAPALLVAGAFFMEFLDGTVIATALPDMAKDFGVTAVELNIGISAYLITLAVLIPASGWIADRFGARAIFTLALAIFTPCLGLLRPLHRGAYFCRHAYPAGDRRRADGPCRSPGGTANHAETSADQSHRYPHLAGAGGPHYRPALGALSPATPAGTGSSLSMSRWASQPSSLRCALSLIFAKRNGAPSISPALSPPQSRWSVWSPRWNGSGDRQPQIWPTLALAVLGFGCLTYAIRHFRRATAPMVRLDALQVPTFRVTMYGGSLFRSSISAVPFLLPLLFQVGFGMDPFHSGLLVLAVFVGNLTIKPATTPLIRWLGFRRLLLINGALNVCSLLACALLTPQTPVWAIMLILYLGGVFRSIQFTGVSTLAFADVPAAQMSDANTLFSTASQLAVGLGITLGAIGIRLGEQVGDWLHLSTLPGISFRLSFVFIAVICLVGMIDSLHLAKTAGSSVSEKKTK